MPDSAALLARVEAEPNPKATKYSLVKVVRRLAQTRNLDVVVNVASTSPRPTS